MEMKKKHSIVSEISDIISQELIENALGGGCLVSTALLFEELERRGIESRIICGSVMYDSEVKNHYIPVHFWVTVDNKIYDPTLKVTRHFAGQMGIENVEYKYINKVFLSRFSDLLMIRSAEDIKHSRNTDNYFSKAPENVLNIRRSVFSRAKEV